MSSAFAFSYISFLSSGKNCWTNVSCQTSAWNRGIISTLEI